MPSNIIPPGTSAQRTPTKSGEETTTTKPKPNDAQTDETLSSLVATEKSRGLSSSSPPNPFESVSSESSSYQAKASGSEQPSKVSSSKLAQGKELAEHAAGSAKQAILLAKDDSAQLLHEATDKAVDVLQSSVDYLEERGNELGRRLEGAVARGQHYLRYTTRTSSRFVRAHALPLALLGTGLGWLAWSMRRQRRVVSEPNDLAASVRVRSGRRDAPVAAWTEIPTSQEPYGRRSV